MNKVLTYVIMLDLLTVACIHFLIILIELKKVLSQKLSVCVARLPSYLNEPYQKLWLLPSYTVNALAINKYTVQICMYTVEKCTYTAYRVHIYSTHTYAH